MAMTSKIEEAMNVMCKIDRFRYLSNINNISLLDGTYFERLITYCLKNKNFICFEGVVDLNDLLPIFQLTTIEGVKAVLNRLNTSDALSLYTKIGKHHENKYAVCVNAEYTKYFFQK